MFGGYTDGGVANDLFSFNITSLQWTWVGGSKLRNADASWRYGQLGVESSLNWPPARFSHGWAADRAWYKTKAKTIQLHTRDTTSMIGSQTMLHWLTD